MNITETPEYFMLEQPAFEVFKSEYFDNAEFDKKLYENTTFFIKMYKNELKFEIFSPKMVDVTKYVKSKSGLYYLKKEQKVDIQENEVQFITYELNKKYFFTLLGNSDHLNYSWLEVTYGNKNHKTGIQLNIPELFHITLKDWTDFLFLMKQFRKLRDIYHEHDQVKYKKQDSSKLFLQIANLYENEDLLSEIKDLLEEDFFYGIIDSELFLLQSLENPSKYKRLSIIGLIYKRLFLTEEQLKSLKITDEFCLNLREFIFEPKKRNYFNQFVPFFKQCSLEQLKMFETYYITTYKDTLESGRHKCFVCNALYRVLCGEI